MSSRGEPESDDLKNDDNNDVSDNQIDLEQLRLDNQAMVRKAESDFELIDRVEWADDVRSDQMVGEMARKPKMESKGDPCGCILEMTEEGMPKLACNDLTCVMYACQEECRSNCTAGPACGNQRLQHQEWKALKVFDAGKKGLGLKVLESVQKGDLITEYVGKAIPKSYLPRLFRNYERERRLYIMALDSNIYLDARHKGGLARYINHSCEPNCIVERWKVRGIVRAAIVSLTDMSPDTELTFDYQWDRKRGRAPTKCHCGSANCRGTLEAPKSLEEQQLEASLSSHWKKPFLQRAGQEIVNRSIRVFSHEAQQYFWGDVTQYDETNGQHLVMYRHDREEVWEDLKNQDWMLLNEEAEQFIIAKKTKPAPSSAPSLLASSNIINPNADRSNGAAAGVIAKNYLFVQTPVKEKLYSLSLFERCQTKCQVNISSQQMCRPPLGPTTPEEVDKFKALDQSYDGSVWKLSVVGVNVAEAIEIVAKAAGYWTKRLEEEQRELQRQSNGGSALGGNSMSAASNAGSNATSTNSNLCTTEVVLPRCIVEAVKQRLPAMRERCRSVSITFIPSESKSKQFAKLILEATLVSDLNAATEQLWTQLFHCCADAQAPKTPTGMYQDLGFLGGSLTSAQFQLLLDTTTTERSGSKKPYATSDNTSSRLQDAKEDLSRRSPFLASFEATYRCSIWVQSDADKGRIDGTNRRVSEATPYGPRKMYFGCDPREIPNLWGLINSRASELARGVKYLYLGADRLYQPYMMRNGGEFFELVQSITRASVTIDSMTGDHLRIDGKDASNVVVLDGSGTSAMSEEERASLAVELVRLQIELYRDHCIRQQNWLFGRDWTLIQQSAPALQSTPSSSDTNPSASSTSNAGFLPTSIQGSPFDGRSVSNACLEIGDIASTLKLGSGVAAHAVVILYRFISVVTQKDDMKSGLKIREVALSCLFLSNKAQKLKKWKTLEELLEAAYATFYPGANFDSSKEEVLVMAEKTVGAEAEVMTAIDYDLFWRGFDWVVAATSAQKNGAVSAKIAASAVSFACSGPVLAAGPVLWLKYGAEYIFAAATAFMEADLDKVCRSLSLIPLKVSQAADIITESVRFSSSQVKRSNSHRLLRDGKRKLVERLPKIKVDCIRTMSQGISNNGLGVSTDAEKRYWMIGNRSRKRRMFCGLTQELVKTCIVSAIDGISAESTCAIYVEKSANTGYEDVVLEGSWRALSIAEYLLDKAAKKHDPQGLPEARDADGNPPDQSRVQSKGESGILSMEDVETGDGWSGTIQSSIIDDAYWGRKTGGKCAVPAKMAEKSLRNVGLRWWIPSKYGPNATGSICDMFMVRTGGAEKLNALANLAKSFVGASADFSILNNWGNENGSGKDRDVAVSLSRWPSEKVSRREMTFVQGRDKQKKDSSSNGGGKTRSNSSIKQIGFSAAALQEMQLLNHLHGLIRSPQGHPNFLLPFAIAVAAETDDADKNFSVNIGVKDMNRSIEDDIFSLTRTSEENEIAAQKERKRKDMVSGPHLMFQPTPFILQKFMVRKKSKEPGEVAQDNHLSPTILAAWFHDLLSALVHCHSNNVLLRSLMGDQIVVDHSGVAKLGVLYRATLCEDREAHADPLELCTKDKERYQKMKKSKSSDEAPANFPYEAPEMLLGSPKHTMETDIWMMGCILSHLLIRKAPFAGTDRETLMRSIYKVVGSPSSKQFREAAKFPYYKKGEKKYKRDLMRLFRMEESDIIKYGEPIDLIGKMLQLDPSHRISAIDALNHQYMTEYAGNSDSTSFRRNFVNDWMELKGRVMGSAKSQEDEIREREQGIKRKAMLMAASSKPAGAADDDLYNMDDMLDAPTKKQKS